jgi:hypothetical protein
MPTATVPSLVSSSADRQPGQCALGPVGWEAILAAARRTAAQAAYLRAATVELDIRFLPQTGRRRLAAPGRAPHRWLPLMLIVLASEAVNDQWRAAQPPAYFRVSQLMQFKTMEWTTGTHSSDRDCSRIGICRTASRGG